MKAVFILTCMLLFFACNGDHTDNNNTLTSGDCACEAAEDTRFFATQLHLQKENGPKKLSYHCATIATAIASVSDEEGMERCENLYELQCIADLENSLILSDSFTYFSEELSTMDLTKTGAQNLFFETLKNKEQQYFELTIANQQILSVTKINLQ